jgi:tetratricopeptide (TPR) repeat protein
MPRKEGDVRRAWLICLPFLTACSSIQPYRAEPMAQPPRDPKAFELLRQAYDTHLQGDRTADFGRFDAAGRLYRAAFDLASLKGDEQTAVEAQLGMAHEACTFGHYEAAYALCTQVAEVRPGLNPHEQAMFYTVLALAQALKSRREGIWGLLTAGLFVKGSLDRALAAEPNFFLASYMMGRYYLAAPGPLGNREEAEKAFRSAIQHGGNHFIMRAWHVRSLQLLGQRAGAEQELAFYQKQFADVPVARKYVEKLKAGQDPMLGPDSPL